MGLDCFLCGDTIMSSMHCCILFSAIVCFVEKCKRGMAKSHKKVRYSEEVSIRSPTPVRGKENRNEEVIRANRNRTRGENRIADSSARKREQE